MISWCPQATDCMHYKEIGKGNIRYQSMTNGESVSVSLKAMPTMLKLPITIKDRNMTIPNTTKRELPPTHPGEMLKEDFMPDFDLNATLLAKALGVSRQTINEILRERRAITPAMALRLSRLFGNSPEFWLNAQHSRDLWDSEQRFHKELSQIQPLNAA
jgi:addiction module HigA family antidote